MKAHGVLRQQASAGRHTGLTMKRERNEITKREENKKAESLFTTKAFRFKKSNRGTLASACSTIAQAGWRSGHGKNQCLPWGAAPVNLLYPLTPTWQVAQRVLEAKAICPSWQAPQYFPLYKEAMVKSAFCSAVPAAI